MTRKDYEKIASVLFQTRSSMAFDEEAMDALDRMIEAFAHMLALDNPRFDSQRFFKAAGYEGDLFYG